MDMYIYIYMDIQRVGFRKIGGIPCRGSPGYGLSYLGVHVGVPHLWTLPFSNLAVFFCIAA